MAILSLPCPAGPRLDEAKQRLAVILGSLRAVVAARAGRDRSMVPVAWMVWAFLSRVTRRFDALLARVAAGRTARPSRPRPARPAAVASERATQMPRAMGWLPRLMWDTRAMGTQLQALLAEPEMQALLAAEPAALRILRPLCRMLDIAPPEPVAVVTPAAEPAQAAAAEPPVAAGPPAGEDAPSARPGWRGG